MRSDYSENKKNRVGLRYAINGLKYAFKNEINIRIHFLIALLVLIAGFVLTISVLEWVLLLLMIGFVITAELLNTAVETMLDYLAPQWHPMAGSIKDLTAGAVLVTSIVAFIIGLIIFLPKIVELVFN
ncbi:diacylglycerol kinase family protein [Amphibacillus indicireducens]|uniref:Diacylglycerol kinase n=1 Tax=Amphibacillus indicireducens TaxID=1076330 RepID=A0ABP7W1C3_9BACI